MTDDERVVLRPRDAETHGVVGRQCLGRVALPLVVCLGRVALPLVVREHVRCERVRAPRVILV